MKPVLGVELGRQVEGDPTGRALTRAEVGRLLALLPESGPYRWFVVAMLFTGMRIGEVAALTVADCDLEEFEIRVSKSASPGRRGEIVIGTTKNGKTRLVQISDQLLEVIELARIGKGPDDRLFSGPQGGTLTSKNLSRALKWPSIRNQIKRFPAGEAPLRWHDLRHTNLTHLAIGGVVLPDLMAIAGHSTMAVTQKYLNTGAEAARRVRAIQSQLYADFEVIPRPMSKGGEAAEIPAMAGKL